MIICHYYATFLPLGSLLLINKPEDKPLLVRGAGRVSQGVHFGEFSKYVYRPPKNTHSFGNSLDFTLESWVLFTQIERRPASQVPPPARGGLRTDRGFSPGAAESRGELGLVLGGRPLFGRS